MSKQQLLDHRVLGLPAHPASAGLARRLIEEVLEDVVPGEVLENAQLLVSEVVTNAIVHARSDIGLTVSLVREFVRVEVADHSPHLPVLKQCDDDSVTGYGLDLVARLAADFGVVTHEAGKAVWFTLGQHAGRSPNPGTPTEATASFAAHPLDAAAGPQQDRHDAGGAMVDVTLLGVPVGLYCTWHDQAATALREQLLMHLGHDGASNERAADEIATVNAALPQLAQVTDPVFRARGGQPVRPQHSSGQPMLDVSFRLPGSLIPCFGLLRQVLEKATEFEAEHVLLAPDRGPQVSDVQDWCCAELLRQASCLKPTRWRS